MKLSAESANNRRRRGRPRKHPPGVSRHERERMAGQRVQKLLLQRGEWYRPVTSRLSICCELAKLGDTETIVLYSDMLLRDYRHLLCNCRSTVALIRATRTDSFRPARADEFADRLWRAAFDFMNTRERCRPETLRTAALAFSRRAFAFAEELENTPNS